jgi:type I restriction enzyme S subunit
MENNMREDWIECELGYLCDFVGGGTPSKSNLEYWNGNIPWASIKDIKGDFLEKTQDFITEIALEKSASNLAFENEIILATRINPGKSIISKIKTAINQDLKIVKHTAEIDTKFLFYNFKNIEKTVIKLSSGTTVLGINLNNLNTICIPLAPLPIQRAIVSKIEALFSDLDNGIANFKKAQEQLKVYRQAVLKKAFEGGFSSITNEELRMRNEELGITNEELRMRNEELGITNEELRMRNKENQENQDNHTNQKNHSSDNLPEGWKWVKISDVCDMKAGYFIKADEINSEFENGLFPCYGGNGLRGYVKSTTHEGLFPIVGRQGALCGNVHLVNDKFHATEHAVVVTAKEDIDIKCLYYKLTEMKLNQYSTGTAQPGLSVNKILPIEIIYPSSLEEQTQIVQEIESRLSVTDNLEFVIRDSIEKAEALRQSILKKAFEGKLLSEAEIEQCKKEADYEPAGELLKKITNGKLRMTNEKLQTANGKLRITNEKLQMTNGELRITNGKLRMTNK